MKLKEVRIQNFRAFSDTKIQFNDYTCLVGPNGVGKSVIIEALNIFFRGATASQGGVDLQLEDFHQRDIYKPIRITLVFNELSPSAEADFQHYFRHGELIVYSEATWNPASNSATATQHGLRRAMSDFAPFFQQEEDGAKVATLATTYSELREKYEELPQLKVKQKMADALRFYESAHDELCTEIPSRAEFYGVGGRGLLNKHIQWVHVPAVKDAIEETAEGKNTWLGQLIQRAVRSKVSFDEELNRIRTEARGQYDALLSSQQSALEEISTSLTARMCDWAHPDSILRLKWESDPVRSVSILPPFVGLEAGDTGFAGCLVRQGHGFQRLYLLVLIQELANTNTEDAPTLLLACEEPELYQHPPQARHMAGSLDKLATSGAQVLVCTHSPYFVSGNGFPDVRVVRRKSDGSDSEIAATGFNDVSKKLAEAGSASATSEEGARLKLSQLLQPNVNEMFFAPVLVLVEGAEDAAYITTHLELSGKQHEFRRLGCYIVPAGGKNNLPQLVAVAKCLGIKAFTVFDIDHDQCFPATDSTKEAVERCARQKPQHERINKTILALHGLNIDALSQDDVWEKDVVAWKNNIGDMIREELTIPVCQNVESQVRKEQDWDEPTLAKNSMFIGEVMSKLWDSGYKSTKLDKLTGMVITYARTTISKSNS